MNVDVKGGGGYDSFEGLFCCFDYCCFSGNSTSTFDL